MVPPGLPAYPGPGWEPDSPPGSGVVARAHALLKTLWQHGEGTRKTEQTNGRWITYVARMLQGKKGVVAYRLKPEPVRMSTMPVPARPKPKPIKPKPKPPPEPEPKPKPKSPVALRTLRRGSSGDDVKAVQRRLNELGHNVGAVDGKFGPATERGVRSFQSAERITVDGIVGPQTYGKLFG